jgi:hypothetical protein
LKAGTARVAKFPVINCECAGSQAARSEPAEAPGRRPSRHTAVAKAGSPNGGEQAYNGELAPDMPEGQIAAMAYNEKCPALIDPPGPFASLCYGT